MTDSIFEADELTAAQDANTAPPEDQQGEAQPAEQQQAEPQPEQPVDDRVRGPDGKFAPKEGDDPEKPRMVNYGALKEAREKGNQWKQEAEQYKATLARIAEMRARVAQLQQQLPAIQHDPETDPTGVNFLAAEVHRLSQADQQRTQQQQYSQVDMEERRVLGSALTQAETEFRTQAPDYDAAINHLTAARARELHRYGMAPDEIGSVLTQEALELTANAVRMGISPAALAYDIAQDRGYRPAQGEQAAPATPAQPLNPAIAQIQAINKGQAVSKSLGGNGGVSAPTDINAQALANMSDDEFARIYSTPEGRRLFDQLNGG